MSEITVGERHGKLVIIDDKRVKAGDIIPDGSGRVAKRTYIHCKCDCGKDIWTTLSQWNANRVNSCGKCMQPETGFRYGKLTVIRQADSKYRKHENGRSYPINMWLCKCDCGNETIVSQSHLISGHTKSCGKCNNIELSADIDLDKYSELLITGHNILYRCRSIKSPSFPIYGGRGIECLLGNTPQEVALSLYNIPGYRKGLHIDRIDNNSHYVLGNLRWVTAAENDSNKLINYHHTFHDIALRPMRRVSFETISNNEGWNIDEFDEIDMKFQEYSGLASHDSYSLFIHKSIKDDKIFFVKRILNFWAKYGGKDISLHVDSGVRVHDNVNKLDIALYMIIKNDESIINK